ncbi:hypothetical protein [Luteibacter sp. 9135]|nr:hypothetical protein [Luteibacter sp. 9135]
MGTNDPTPPSRPTVSAIGRDVLLKLVAVVAGAIVTLGAVGVAVYALVAR